MPRRIFVGLGANAATRLVGLGGVASSSIRQVTSYSGITSGGVGICRVQLRQQKPEACPRRWCSRLWGQECDQCSIPDEESMLRPRARRRASLGRHVRSNRRRPTSNVIRWLQSSHFRLAIGSAVSLKTAIVRHRQRSVPVTRLLYQSAPCSTASTSSSVCSCPSEGCCKMCGRTAAGAASIFASIASAPKLRPGSAGA